MTAVNDDDETLGGQTGNKWLTDLQTRKKKKEKETPSPSATTDVVTNCGFVR